MPSGDLETWGVEWIITLPSGNTENGSLKMTSGKNLELVQSTNGIFDVTREEFVLT